MFCEACWKAVVVVVGIPHHGHVNSPSSTFAKKELKNKLKIKRQHLLGEKKKKSWETKIRSFLFAPRLLDACASEH